MDGSLKPLSLIEPDEATASLLGPKRRVAPGIEFGLVVVVTDDGVAVLSKAPALTLFVGSPLSYSGEGFLTDA